VYGRVEGVASTVCANKRTTEFVIKPNNNANALTAMTTVQLDALIREIVQRFCDHSANNDRCLRRASQLRNSQTSGEAQADGSYIIRVTYPDVADDSTTQSSTLNPFFNINRFVTLDVTDNGAIYTDAAGNAESGAGYSTTTGSGSGAASTSATTTLIIAAIAIAVALPRFM